MLDGLLGGLIVAWILTWFNFDGMFIDTLYDLFKVTISTSNYYIIFAFIGFVAGAFRSGGSR